MPYIAMRIGGAFRWGKLPAGACLKPSEAAYISNLTKWGMSDGIGVVAYGPASRVGFVGIGGPMRPDGFETVDLGLMRIAAQTSFLLYCDLIVADTDPLPRLSTRKLDVLHLMAAGKSNSAIARKLNLSQETVDTYVRRIFVKLDVSDRTSAVIKGVSRGIVIATDPQVEEAIRDRRRRNGWFVETE